LGLIGFQHDTKRCKRLHVRQSDVGEARLALRLPTWRISHANPPVSRYLRRARNEIARIPVTFAVAINSTLRINRNRSAGTAARDRSPNLNKCLQLRQKGFLFKPAGGRISGHVNRGLENAGRKPSPIPSASGSALTKERTREREREREREKKRKGGGEGSIGKFLSEK